jgi:hypothetical protein
MLSHDFTNGPGHSPASPELTPDQIEARLRWARRRGYSAWLWPDVAVDAWRSCMLEIERATRLRLADRTPPIRLEPPPGADAAALGIAAFTSGMGPLLGWWLEEGTLAAPADVTFRLRTHLVHGRERAERLGLALRAALDLLDTVRVPAVVLKGAHTGTAVFPEPGTRPAADIDIAIAPADMARTEHALERAGYERVKTRRHPRKSDWRPPGAPRRLRSIEFNHAENPFTVEIHDGLDRVFYGVRTLRFGPPDAWRTHPAPGLHASARILGQPWLSAFLAAHASEELHQLQLVRLVELALVLRAGRAGGALDWEQLDHLLERIDGHRFVWPAFELAEQLAPGTLDVRFRERLAEAASPRMRRALARLSPGTAQHLEGLSLDERFFWAHGPAETLRRLAHLVWPTRGESTPLHRVYAQRAARLLRGRGRNPQR